MDLDPTTNKLYWVQSGGNQNVIRRANTDGSAIEDLVMPSGESPRGIALDLTGGKVYWSTPFAPDIKRASLDGSNQEVVFVTWAAGDALCFDPSEHVLFGGVSSVGVSQVDPVSLTAELVISGGLDGPFGLAIVSAQKKMYWTGVAGVYSANLDGTGISPLVTQLNSARGLALDTSSGTIYWAEWYSGRIRRTDIPQGVIEDVATNLIYPDSVALAIPDGKVYWTDPDQQIIQRANLDGTNPESVVTGIGFPRAIAVDSPSNQLFWTCPGLRSSALDGTDIESLVQSGFCFLDALYVASVPRRLYLTETVNSFSTIRRANTDMSGISVADRQCLRQEKSVQRLQQFKSWLESQQAQRGGPHCPRVRWARRPPVTRRK